MNLEYKGWKGTRIQLLAIFCLSVSAGYIWGDVTAAQWLDFLKWAFGLYAGSEVGAKASSAYKERP